MRAFCFVLSLGLLVGCTPKEQPVPPPVSHTPPGLWDALTAEETWRPPVVLAEPESAPPEPPPPPPPANAQVYAWSPNEVYPIAVPVGAVTDVQFEPGEQVSGWAAGDRAYLAHDKETRWQEVLTKSGQEYGPAQEQMHHLWTCPHEKLRQDVVVATNRRVYHLALECVRKSPVQIYAWTYPPRPQPPGPPPPPRVLPDPTQPARYAIGWQVQAPEGTAAILPTHILADAEHVYVIFPMTMLAENAPMARAVTATGAPQLLNYSQPAGKPVLRIDGIPQAFELRYGQGIGGPVVRVTRPAEWVQIQCPGHPGCPVWPGVLARHPRVARP